MGKTIRKEKDLTKEEKKRLDKFDKVCEELESKGYERHDFLISVEKANTTGYLIPLPFVVIYILLYFLLGNKFVFDDIADHLLLFFLLALVSLFIHEGLHGITHAIFARNHFKDIDFGVIIKKLTPYCTCCSYEKKYQYILAAGMPFIILGVVFGTITLFLNSTLLFFLTTVNFMGTSGDLLVIILVLRNKSKKKDVLYYDHPTDVGVVMFDK